MSGQADWSFAAFADLSKVGGWVKNSSRRALSTAILTVSSNRSNSTSVIALSRFESAEILTVRIAIVPKMTDMRLQFMIAPFSSLGRDEKKGPLGEHCLLLSAIAGHLFIKTLAIARSSAVTTGKPTGKQIAISPTTALTASRRVLRPLAIAQQPGMDNWPLSRPRD